MEGERRSSYFFVGVLAAVVARDSKELTETTCKRLEGAALNGRRSFSPPPRALPSPPPSPLSPSTAAPSATDGAPMR